MIPFLAYPLALIALAALPALAAIYILRNRFRRRQVSSLMLWQFRVQSKEGGARVNRLQLPLIFFLELLTLLLLVTAAAGPHWKLAQATRPLIVVLDDSFSMRAGTDKTAQDRARESLEKLFRFQAPPSTRIILAGTEPRLLGGSAKKWSEAESLLAEWRCQAPAASIDLAVTLAGEIGKQQANVLVLTDRKPAEEKFTNDRLQWRSFGNPSANVAIVNASRTAHGDEDRCLLEIANFSGTAQSVRLLVQTGSNDLQQSRISFAPREQQRLVFNVPRTVPTLQATLDQDVLDMDNSVQLLPPIRKRVRVKVALTNSVLTELADRTLAATGLRAAISEDPELVLHHSDFPPGSNCWNLKWDSDAKAAAYSGPFVIDSSHPLAQGVTLEGAVWAAAATTNSTDDIPVILAGNVSLLSVREDLVGRRFITLSLNPELSTVPRMPDWPVLLWNILEWRVNESVGLRQSNARLGTEVVLKTGGGAVTVVWPDKTEKVFAQTSDQIALETPLPGLYSVILGGSTNSFAVNPLAADESNLQPCASGEWGKWGSSEEQRLEQSPLAWILALGGLGLLVAHLGILAAGKGGS